MNKNKKVEAISIWLVVFIIIGVYVTKTVLDAHYTNQARINNIQEYQEIETIEDIRIVAPEEIKQEHDWIDKINLKEDKSVLIKWNNLSYSVNIFADRVKSMQDKGYSNTRILDLLAIMNMECWKYSWDCFYRAWKKSWDVWPMQINIVHREQYFKSWEFYYKKDWGGLFIYQLEYANELLDNYEAWWCSEANIVNHWVWDTYNQKRWRCIAFRYNWHPKNKFSYNTLGWERREEIKKLIF